jgi:hypothetical protein
MGGLHQGGLWLGEEGEHDECQELQAWEARQQLNFPPCARTCSKPASMLVHAAAASGAVACASEGKAAQASPGGEAVISSSMCAARKYQIAVLWLQRATNENKWRWELLGRAKTALELAWRDSTRHAQAWMRC